MPGGDFAMFNKRFARLQEEYNSLRIVPVAVVPSNIVSDVERRKNHEMSKELHSQAVDANNQFIKNANSLKNDISNQLHELQTNQQGGHLEDWQYKISTLVEWISKIETRNKADEPYL